MAAGRHRVRCCPVRFGGAEDWGVRGIRWAGRLGVAGHVPRVYNAWLHRKFIAIVDLFGFSWEDLGREGAGRGARAASGTVWRDRLGYGLRVDEAVLMWL